VKAKIALLLLLITVHLGAQDNNRSEVKTVVDDFIQAMNQQDTKTLLTLMDRNIGFMTVFFDGNKSILAAESVEMFIENIESSSPGMIKEELLNYKITASDALATVWSEYNFYVSGSLSHCGENAFQLYKSPKGWRIIQITDTRYNKEKCRNKTPTDKYERKATLIKFIDNWHRAASKAEMEPYFNAMSDDAIYVGTDPDEFWTKPQFKAWAKSYFENGKAWHFETIKRDIFFTDDEDLAWFNEKLNTSMGTCHATGVAEYTRNGWKIKYYQLSVTVSNELLEEFLELKKSTNVEE